MNKLELTFSKSARSRRGSGRISWSQFQAMLRYHGVLMEGQKLEKLTATKDGIEFTTSKTGNQK